MITITVAATLKLHNLPDHLTGQFIQENTFRNPKYDQLKRMNFWTGNTSPTIQLYQQDADALILPRGYLPSAIHQIKAANLPFTIDDHTVCPVSEFSAPDGELYPFQAKALEDLLRYRSGILSSPTGSGKTVMLLSAIPKLKTNTLILTHTSELLAQTMDRVRSWLGVEPGVIGGGQEDIQPITIGMVQSLVKKDLEGSGIAGYFGCCIVDEVHHSPARTWAKILQNLPAKYRYGFSATCWRRDGLQILMRRLISSRTTIVNRQEVEKAGKLIWPSIELIHTGYQYPIQDAGEWTQMITNLVHDQERNHFIEKEVRKRVNGNTQALILTSRIQHANILSRMLEDLSPVVLTGELGKAARAKAMGRVRAGANITIGTTSLLSEGIDIPSWNLLFLATPISGGPMTKQAVGRVTRSTPGKEKALVVDFVDSRVPMLAAAYRKRQAIYHAA